MTRYYWIQTHSGKVFCTEYEKSKVVADKVALDAASEGMPIVPVYPGVIYGPGKVTAGNIVARMVNVSSFFLPFIDWAGCLDLIIFQLTVEIKSNRFDVMDFGNSYTGNVLVVDSKNFIVLSLHAKWLLHPRLKHVQWCLTSHLVRGVVCI